MEHIKLYTRPRCIQCKMTKRYFEEHMMPYRVIDITDNPDATEYLKAKGYQTVPVVEFEETFINGFSPEKLATIMVS